MKDHSFVSNCLNTRCICLVVTLATACSFDESQLRVSGATGPIAGASGSGGTSSGNTAGVPAGSGGASAIGTGGSTSGRDAGMPDAPDIRTDVPLGGSAGNAGGIARAGGRGGALANGGVANYGGTGMGGASGGAATLPSKCGNGLFDPGEQCDDQNAQRGDGCSSACQIEPGWTCAGWPSVCTKAVCGNGIHEAEEDCDCGTDSTKLPTGCAGPNGVLYGDGQGCSKFCTKEPNCRDSAGRNQACTARCGDGNVDPGEACDDGNQVSGDGCSNDCKPEAGFTCTTTSQTDTSPCTSDPTKSCLAMPIIYRDFQPENVAAGGHPDFYWLGTKAGGATAPTTICVPDAGGPARGNDSTARCWDIAAPSLLNGKPQYNTARASNLCACQFSDWNIGNSFRILGGYTMLGNDSPLSDGQGGYIGGSTGTINQTNPSGSVTGRIAGYNMGGGPIFKGTVPIVKDANSFNQWFTNDITVNKPFPSILEMSSIGTNVYQYTAQTHLAKGGFFPLDTLNASQTTLCNLWPYWNRSSGTPIWTTCAGDQYLFPPFVLPADCLTTAALVNSGCWVTAVPGAKHNYYFTAEARRLFTYDSATGLTLQISGENDIFVFVNGILVLDLGGTHGRLPGRVAIQGPAGPSQANITEGGCLDTTGDLPPPSAAGYIVGGCTPSNSSSPPPVSPDDFRVRTANLNMNDGGVYEIAIFSANRHPTQQDLQVTLGGITARRSICQPGTGTGTGTATLNAAGAACAASAECQTGLTCLDGVCCTQTSCPQCRNCGAMGTCNAAVFSKDDTTGTNCAGTSTCDGSGTCKKKGGETCTAPSDCTAGACTDKRCCTQTCGVCQACTGLGGTCVAVTSADDLDTCTGLNTCSSTGLCKKKDGGSCLVAGDCATGNCTDSHCCSQSCGACQACTGAGGTCVAVTSADDPDTCTGTSTCDATGKCKKNDGQACTLGTDCLSGTCDTSNVCAEPVPTTG